MATWIEPTETKIPEALIRYLDGDILLARALVHRGVKDEASARAFFEPEASPPAESLQGIQEAVDLIEGVIQAGKRLLIWGDFDVDGQTATTVLVSALRQRGANVAYHIPIREVESHGVHVATLKRYIDAGVDLLITCDTGITAHDAVGYAKSSGVHTILTDHHTPPELLPPADVIINPKLHPDSHHASFQLAGVGVAFKLAEALLRSAPAPGDAASLLDLVALGTVADVVPLVQDNRRLVRQGLEILRDTQRLGLLTLMELAELDPKGVTENHISYAIAPRLNALGRLADANPIVEFLTTADAVKARIFAAEIEGLNYRRKLITEQIYHAAQRQIQDNPSLLKYSALVLAHPQWHAGIIGIVASRLAEYYRKPVILISAPAGQLGRGSARSIDGINILEAIASQRRLLAGYGGHALAAGVSLPPENIPAFRKGLSEAIDQQSDQEKVVDALRIDGYLDFSELSAELVMAIQKLAPFGAGNPPVTLAARNLKVDSAAWIGRLEEHRLVRVVDPNGATQDVLWWQSSEFDLPDGMFDLAFTVTHTNYRGRPEIQLQWIDYRTPEAGALELSQQKQQRRILDFRSLPNPGAMLEKLIGDMDCAVWCEGLAKPPVQCSSRQNLQHHEALVIYTPPPSRDVLLAVIETVAPQTLILMAEPAGLETKEAFLKRLSGLAKYAIHHKGGKADILSLCSACAQTEWVIRTGLDWLQARGLIDYETIAENQVHFKTGSGKSLATLPEIDKKLTALLDETNAFRNFYLTADVQSLV